LTKRGGRSGEKKEGKAAFTRKERKKIIPPRGKKTRRRGKIPHAPDPKGGKTELLRNNKDRGGTNALKKKRKNRTKQGRGYMVTKKRMAGAKRNGKKKNSLSKKKA